MVVKIMEVYLNMNFLLEVMPILFLNIKRSKVNKN